MPSVPVAPTISPAVSSTTQLNTMRDAINYLNLPPLAELRQSGAQSVPNNTWTAITFDVEDWDSDVDGTGGHSTSSNTSRYTARYPGWYFVSGGVGFAVNTTGQRGCRWSVNGVTQTAGASLWTASSAFESCIPARGKYLYLAISDYVELYGYQSSGGALNTDVGTGTGCNMAIRWVSR